MLNVCIYYNQVYQQGNVSIKKHNLCLYKVMVFLRTFSLDFQTPQNKTVYLYKRIQSGIKGRKMLFNLACFPVMLFGM